MPLAQALDVHRVGEELLGRLGHQRAVGLLVEEVAPPADGLPQHQPGRDQIGQRPEADLFPLGEDQRGDHAADDGAVDGDAAVPDVQHADGIVRVLLPLKDHIVDARKHDGRGDGQQRVVQHAVGVDALLLGLHVDHHHRNDHRQRDEYAVPVDVVPEHGERNGIGTEHDCALLNQQIFCTPPHTWGMPSL